MNNAAYLQLSIADPAGDFQEILQRIADISVCRFNQVQRGELVPPGGMTAGHYQEILQSCAEVAKIAQSHLKTATVINGQPG